MEKLMQALVGGARRKCLYHFTDTRNLDSIRQEGLLSLREIGARSVNVAAYGGDEDSRGIDQHYGLDRFVHLCLASQHPMEYHAVNRGSIKQSIFIQVDPSVLQIPGTMFCPVVSTTGGATIRPISEVDEAVDFEVAFGNVSWSDPELKPRIQAMRKFEILVPTRVPPELLLNI